MSNAAVSQSALATISELYRDGRYLEAYEIGRSEGPITTWSGTTARLMGGRLAHRLGGSRLGEALLLRAWRDDPAHREAFYYHVATVLSRRGPWTAWELLKTPPTGDASGDGHDHKTFEAELLSLRARVLAAFRDFDEALNLLDRADALEPGSAWLAVDRCACLMRCDRNQDALATIEHALELQPGYSNAIGARMHLLQILQRTDEAIAFGSEFLESTQDCTIPAHLALLQLDQEDHEAAARSLDRFEALVPLMDKSSRDFLFANRADVAYHRGDLAAAIECAEQVEGHFHRRIAERLKDETRSSRRLFCPVPFIRQSHMTCGPATLSMLAQALGTEACHLEVAGEICYGGTTDYSERNWAIHNGFAAREFTLDVASACALLERGIPFAVATVESNSAHMQVVCGYDERRGVFLVRDPYHPNIGQWLDEEFLERYASRGPRALAIVPEVRGAELAQLPLRNAELFDLFFEAQAGLRTHDHATAVAACDKLAAAAPDHDLVLHARWVLAAYENDAVGVMTNVQQLAERYPEDGMLRLRRLASLRGRGHSAERMELLDEAVAEPPADPVFVLSLAEELARDAGNFDRARKLLRRTMQNAPGTALAYRRLAEIDWRSCAFDRALELYRIAACLEETDEAFSRSFFVACRARGRTEDALALLHARVERLGTGSSQPVTTLFWALDSLDRTEEAFAMLAEATQLHADDGDLLLYAADVHARYGRIESAQDLLARSRGHCREEDRLAIVAKLASFDGDHQRALETWQQILAAEPLHHEALGRVADLLQMTQGRDAAMTQLRETAAAFPFSHDLQRTLAERLGTDGAAEAADVLRKLIELEPSDAWSHRELALRLMDLQQLDEALAVVETACRLDPHEASGHGTRGHLLAYRGQNEPAAEALRTALQCSVDYAFAISTLVSLQRSRDDRRAALDFVLGELVTQETDGDGLLCYYEIAIEMLEPPQVQAALSELCSRRPDLWQAWSCRTQLLHALEQGEEAVKNAQEACQRYPLVPRLYYDLAVALRANEREEEAVAAMEQGLAINPNWGTLLRELADYRQGHDELDEAQHLLEHAVAHDPLDPSSRYSLARLLIARDQQTEALEHLRHAVRQCPGPGQAWSHLLALSTELGRRAEIVEFARTLADELPGRGEVGLMIDEAIDPAETDQRLEVLARAIEVDPRQDDAYDRRAELLAELGRHDEAFACLKTHPAGDELPVYLEGRLAWLEEKRGLRSAAVQRMRGLLETNPLYQWGWLRLLDWLCADDDPPAYRQAAEQAAELMPDSPVMFGYLGEARQMTEDRAGAVEAFGRAVEIAPDYGFGVQSLFDLHLDANAVAEAQELMPLIDEHAHPCPRHFAGLRLAVASGDRDAARQRVVQLAGEEDAEWYLDNGFAILERSGWRADFGAALEEAAAGDRITPYGARLWVQHLVAAKDWKRARTEVDRLLAVGGETGDEVGAWAAHRYISLLGDARRKRDFDAVMKTHQPALAAHPRTWAAVGYTLDEIGRSKDAIAWMADWKTREGVEPWMLLNLAIAMRQTGQIAQAHEVSARAVQIAAGDAATAPHHHLWLAADALAADDLEIAATHVQHFDPPQRDAFYSPIRDAVVAALMAADEDVPWARVRQRFAAARSEGGIRATHYTRTIYKKSLRTVARRRGKWLWMFSVMLNDLLSS